MFTVEKTGHQYFLEHGFLHRHTESATYRCSFDQFAQPVFTLPSMGQMGKLRRLLFEAQTFVPAQLKMAVSGHQSTMARKLPVPEKQARMADLKHRLNGVVLGVEKKACLQFH